MTTTAAARDLAERADLLLTDHRVRAHPWALFDEMREAAPVLRTTSGVWMLTRHADCQSILRDSRMSRKEAAARTSALSGETAEQYTTRLVCEDGAEHRRMRKVVNQAFSARNIARWHPLVEELANFEPLLDRHELEFLNEYARPLSVRALCEVLGVPFEDRSTLEKWMGVLLEHVTGKVDVAFATERHDAMTGIAAYLRNLLDERESDRDGGDLVSILLRAYSDEGRLSERELIGILAEILHAGFESTATTMTNGLLTILSHPEQLRLLVAQPQRATAAVEEMIRFSPPGALRLPRVALEDVDVDGTVIPAGSMVMALTAAANRDPEVVERPHEFDITREPNPHITFGLGEHYCVGNGLARSELVAAFNSMARTCLADMAIDGPIVWRDHHIVRGLEALRIRW
ncbi:cytochrome P450 [Dactylosporangium sp. NPDC005572]|uniref:cytochrome P450 n=1 Tax=Dactylosporangium sp. NPDC005572 TaxID=3156889 RepID=UPI0033A8ECD9